jgi:hypothetical protein
MIEYDLRNEKTKVDTITIDKITKIESPSIYGKSIVETMAEIQAQIDKVISISKHLL